MSSHDDFYSKEATLINSAKRELANGVEKNPVDKLRLLCFTRGATGILSVSRALRNIDKEGIDSLNYEQFKDGIRKSGIDCNEDEIKKMFNCCDVDKQGTITTNEFLDKLRPPMSRSRLNVIDKAFSKVDHGSEGVITLKDLKSIYNVKDHPKYLSGELSEREILSQFLSSFEGNNGKISKEDFLNYYSAVSASIDNDAYFDLVMRRAYKL